METNELPTIKISVVGPPNSGKTTLISLLYEYMKNISVSDDTFEISCPKYKNKRQLEDYLSIILHDKVLPKTWIEGDKYEFDFSIKTSDRIINQKIEFYDVDGDIINEWYDNNVVYEKDKYGIEKKTLKTFRKHLHESQILLLPTDMPVIMEDDSPKFIKSHSALGYNHIKSIAIDWRNYRNEKSSEISFAHVVMTKCETYYNHENRNIVICEERVKECFKGILEELFKAKCGVLYTPVFISGFKVFNKDKSTWKQIDKITWRYDEGFDDCHRHKPFGVNDIWNSIFDIMAYNMSRYLKDGLGKQTLFSFGKDETKEIAIKAIDFFMKIMELKTENINDNFNYNKFLKPIWKKNT